MNCLNCSNCSFISNTYENIDKLIDISDSYYLHDYNEQYIIFLNKHKYSLQKKKINNNADLAEYYLFISNYNIKDDIINKILSKINL